MLTDNNVHINQVCIIKTFSFNNVKKDGSLKNTKNKKVDFNL